MAVLQQKDPCLVITSHSRHVPRSLPKLESVAINYAFHVTDDTDEIYQTLPRFTVAASAHSEKRLALQGY